MMKPASKEPFFLLLAVLMCLLSAIIRAEVEATQLSRRRMHRGLMRMKTASTKRMEQKVRGLQLLDPRNGGKGKRKGYTTDYDKDLDWETMEPTEEAKDDGSDNDYWEVLEGAEKASDDKEESAKGKGKLDDEDESLADDKNENGSDEEVDDVVDEETILGAQESIAPTFKQTTSAPKVSTIAPTVQATEAVPIAQPPTGRPTTPASITATSTPTKAPQSDETVQSEETAAPSFAPSVVVVETLVPTKRTTKLPTESPRTSAPSTILESPLGNNDKNQTDTGGNGEEGGNDFFNGEDYYHLHLVPFAVSIEGDEVSNDLGITSCLLTGMQKNISNLFKIEMENFTIVQFNDEDGDGFRRYDLYFSGFGELLGLPLYPEDYFQEVQLAVLGDGVTFYQKCLDARWADSGRTYIASSLEHDQATVDGIQGNAATTDDTDDGDNQKVQTNLIIGLSVAAVVVALCGMFIASRVLRRGGESAEGGQK